MIRSTVVLCVIAAALFGTATLGPCATAGAAPLLQSTGTWTGQYFSNPNLQGNPALARDDANLDFSWGSRSPGTGLPATGFSVRWTRWVSFDAAGLWTVALVHNDGVRLYVDDALLIDSWIDQPATTHTITVNLTQAFHLVRVEYSHRNGNSLLQLQMISANYPDWRGEYYANSNLETTPAFTRNDSAIQFNFGTTGPGGGLPGSGFSVRWLRGQYLPAGRYRFTTLADDGVRLWVDQQLIVDQWRDQVPTTKTGDVTLTTGVHLLRMEYYNRAGAAQASLSWAPVSGSPQLWKGEYFNNTSATGTVVLSRDYADLNFDWGTAAPGPGIAAGTNWSARFASKRVASLAGYYTVTAVADDGIRVSVDNVVVIDQWHDASLATYAATIYLNAGTHDWRVDLYQHLGSAALHVQIDAGVTTPPIGNASLFAPVVVDETASVASTVTASITSSVTSDAGGAFKSSPATLWHDSPAGYGRHAFWLANSTFASASPMWARWYPSLPRPGLYEVSVYIPGNLATTRNARYWIAHGGTADLRTVNQSLYLNQWVSLGRYDFDASGSEYVALTDVTYEPAGSTVVVFDAVRFAAP